MSKNLNLNTPVRIAWPNLTEPRAFENKGAKSYDCKILIPKSDKAQIKKIHDYVTDAVANSKKLTKQTQKKEALANAIKGTGPKKMILLKDGDLIAYSENDDGTKELKYPEYQGHLVLNVKAYGETQEGERKDPPITYFPKEADGSTEMMKLGDIEREIYGGCWCYFSLFANAYSAGGDCGVSLKINQIMKVQNDEPFVKSAFESDDFEAPEIPETDSSAEDEDF